jgi:hypothetical protein
LQPAPIACEASGISASDALETALRDMTLSLSRDFVDGRIGMRHNTFQHRSRVLRQLTAELALMREEDAIAAKRSDAAS